MIVGYELHIETKKSIYELCEYFKSKGFATDYKMCTEGHGMIKLKHPQKMPIYDFKIKLYEELGETRHYEIMAFDRESFTLCEEWFKDA